MSLRKFSLQILMSKFEKLFPKSYEKLLKDIRKIIVADKTKKAKLETYNIFLDLMEAYSIKLLSGKVYWEKVEEKAQMPGANATYIKIEIKGKKYLKLEADANGANGNDHSVYADAKLIKEGYGEELEEIDIEKYDEKIKDVGNSGCNDRGYSYDVHARCLQFRRRRRRRRHSQRP